MSRQKSMIPVLWFLKIPYHKFKLTAVITNNSFRAWPSSVTPWTTIFVLLLSLLANILALLMWVDGREGEEISVWSLLVKVS